MMLKLSNPTSKLVLLLKLEEKLTICVLLPDSDPLKKLDN